MFYTPHINLCMSLPDKVNRTMTKLAGQSSQSTLHCYQASKPQDTSNLLLFPRTTYKDPLGKTRIWESAERCTRPKNSLIDGVGIVAILEKPSGPELLLQKQFRPPINKVVIEVPAGLVDEGETAEQSAVRELREETGYVGTVEETSPVMFNGLSPRFSHAGPPQLGERQRKS